jgi:hypothetical protein
MRRFSWGPPDHESRKAEERSLPVRRQASLRSLRNGAQGKRDDSVFVAISRYWLLDIISTAGGNLTSDWSPPGIY